MRNPLRIISERVRGMFPGAGENAEFDDELRGHLELLTEENVRRGMPVDEARRQARIRLGNATQIRETHRQLTGLPFLETLAQDVRYALRMLGKAPGFTAVAVLTLALGIGANTAIFSAIQTVLLRPYPYPDSNRLVFLFTQTTEGGTSISAPDYRNYKTQSSSFGQLCAFTFSQPGDLSIGNHSERVREMFATGDLFSILGVHLAVGRSFLESEENSASHAALLSYGLWQSQFAGKSDVIGKRVILDGQLRQVIGILPRNFSLPEENRSSVGVVLPMPWDSTIFSHRDDGNLFVIGRLTAGGSIAQARASLSVVANRIAGQHKDSKDYRGVLVEPFGQEHAELRDPLWALFGAVSFVLLIACGNVSGLLLARGLARRKEFAVRAALGADRGRLVKQMLTESFLLAIFGGALGLAGAWEGAGILGKIGAAAIPALKDLSVNGETAAFAFVASLAATILFGLLPAWKVSSVDVNNSLKGSPLANTRAFRPAQLRGVLVAVQVALAVIVLCGAGVLLRSLHELSSTSPGFEVDHLLTADISKSAAPAAQIAFFDELLGRIASIRGITEAAATSAPPLGSDAIAPMPNFDIPGRHSSGFGSAAMVRVVTPRYFQTIGARIIAGREFTAQDSATAPRVAIINAAIARERFKDRSAIGQELAIYSMDYPARFTPQPGIVRIVGVTQGLKHWFPGGPPHQDFEIYLPYAQSPVADMMLVARFNDQTPDVAHKLQDSLTALEPSALLDNPETMRNRFSETLAPSRFYPLLLALFAAIALVLASVGVYGVIAYWVRERTQEIGIRVALGARSLDVLRLVLLQGLVFVVCGTIAGLAAALALTRFLSGQLYGVTARDPATFISVGILLITVALLACYVPARRAMKVDPMVALRYE